MEKIPVKIVELTSPSGKTAVDVMIDIFDYNEIEGAQDEIRKFKKKYFELVKKAQKIMPKDKSKRKTSHFWQVGKLLYDFNKSIENQFKITNYDTALMRDFEFFKSPRTIAYILELGKYFKKSELSDLIKITIYLELLQKRSALEKANLFEKEKKRLLELVKAKKVPMKMNYRNELKTMLKIKPVTKRG